MGWGWEKRGLETLFSSQEVVSPEAQHGEALHGSVAIRSRWMPDPGPKTPAYSESAPRTPASGLSVRRPTPPHPRFGHAKNCALTPYCCLIPLINGRIINGRREERVCLVLDTGLDTVSLLPLLCTLSSGRSTQGWVKPLAESLTC